MTSKGDLLRIGISCYPTYGGSGVVATELAKALALEGHEVHLLSYAIPARLASTDDGVFFHRVQPRPYPLFDYPPYSLALATKMVEVAKRHALDLMHVHYAVPNAVSAVLARLIRAPEPLPVVTTLHGTDVTLVGSDPSYLATTRFSVLQSDAVTAVSEWLRLTTLEQLSVDCDIEVIPNFVDIDAESPPVVGRSAARWRRSEDERLLVHVSNFRPVKRVLDVVEVFERVQKQLPCRLLLVGDGPDRPIIERVCAERNLEDRVEFLEQLPRVEEALWGADLFLLTSETESFGLAALEALACGVPVIATRAGGIPEVILHDEHGLLYEVGDVDGMAEGALRLLRDHALHRSFAEEARAFALETFRRDEVVGRYQDLYRRVLEQDREVGRNRSGLRTVL
jgi:N-acetyl-alpha-D-glucosaminyl L-malate synthase BshA